MHQSVTNYQSEKQENGQKSGVSARNYLIISLVKICRNSCFFSAGFDRNAKIQIIFGVNYFYFRAAGGDSETIFNTHFPGAAHVFLENIQ